MDPASFEAAVLVVLACTLAGLMLILVEVVLVPGLGAPGIAGGVLLAFGAAYAFWSGGLGWGLVTLAGVGAILAAGLKTLGFTLGSRVVLSEALDRPVGEWSDRIGLSGTAITPLRPAGLARLAGRRVDVTTRSEWIEAGTPIVVVSDEGSSILVREAAEAVPQESHLAEETQTHE